VNTKAKQATVNPTVSVIVCCFTEERWDDLSACLESLFVQTHAPDEIVVIVDHNPAMLERVQQTWEGWVKAYANIHPKGLVGSQNTSLEVVTSDIVAFIDDDTVATPSWTQHLLRHYENPSVIAVGGFITPSWLPRQPRWYPEEFFWIVGGSYKGLPEKLSPVRNLWGGNRSFRRSLMIQAGGFLETPELSNVGVTHSGSDETELCIRLRQHNPNGVILFDPKARVYHKVPAHQATYTYFLARCRSEGCSKAVTRQLAQQDGLSSETTHIKKTLPLAVLRALGQGNIAKAAAISSGMLMSRVGFLEGKRSARNVARQAVPRQAVPRQAVPSDMHSMPEAREMKKV
jgi:Glycosyl transferase family 2